MEMDTDSLYLATTGPLQSIIRSGERAHFFANFWKWFPREACEAHAHNFIRLWTNHQLWQQLHCCEAATLFDTRTPGLFKEEFRGSGMVALNSKNLLLLGFKSNKH